MEHVPGKRDVGSDVLSAPGKHDSRDVSKPAPSQGKFLTGSLIQHVAVMSITSAVGLLATFSVDFVDLLFIAQLDEPGLLAAVGYAGNVLFFAMSANIGIMIATGVLISNAVGAGDAAATGRLIMSALLWSSLLGICMYAALFFSLRSAVSLLGATGHDHATAVMYLLIIIPFGPLGTTSIVISSILRAFGDAKGAMTCTLVSATVNAVADPLLIFVAGLGIHGAALATVAGRVSNFAVAVWLLVRNHMAAPVVWPAAAEWREDCEKLTRMAVPAILTNLASPVSTSYVIRTLATYSEDAVAGMTIAARLTPIAFATVLSASGAVGPIVGQNNGAKQFDRVRETYRAALLFVTATVLFAAVILFALRTPLATIFKAEGDALALLRLFCGPLALAYMFNGVIFIGNAVCNNLKYPFLATAVNWARHSVGTIPPVMVFSTGLGLGAPGVLIGREVGGAVFALVSVGCVISILAGLEDRAAKELVA